MEQVPTKRNPISGVLVFQIIVLQEQLKLVGQFELIIILAVRTKHLVFVRYQRCILGLESTIRDGVD